MVASAAISSAAVASVPSISVERASDLLPDLIFGEWGAAVVEGVLSPRIAGSLRRWSAEELASRPDRNARHPKHAAKRLVNNVAQRLGESDPGLLCSTLTAVGALGDALLGLARVGSLTMHVTEPAAGGEPGLEAPQTAHVDYPLHAGSGGLWEDLGGVGLGLADVTTAHQRDRVYPFLTVQVLVALEDIDERNGCTELVPGSHRWSDVDRLVQRGDFRRRLDEGDAWRGTRMKAGDVLVFNRRIVHRAGVNRSASPRHACIAQLVMPFAVPQQSPPTEAVVREVVAEATRRGAGAAELKRLELRLRFPYPRSTEEGN